MANNIDSIVNCRYEPEQDIRSGTGVYRHPNFGSNIPYHTGQQPMMLPNRIINQVDPNQFGYFSASPASGLPYSMNTAPNAAYFNQYGNGERIASRPPLPPPRSTAGSQNYYNAYSNPYGMHSSYMPSYNRPMIGSYSPYSQRPYGTPMTSVPSELGFIEEAHESSREAFASIESIVSAFGSINTMVESTYYALQSSFNAVLSVGENFSRLKSHFSQILSAFTFIRTLQWLYRKLLFLAGLRAQDPTTEAAWKLASRPTEDFPTSENSTRSSWPMFAFLVAIYAGPFLMWKFLSSIMKKGSSKDNWTKTTSNQYYGIAKYNYKAQGPEELSFSTGDHLLLAPKELQTDKSWPLVFNGKKSGQVPINYIEVKFNKQHPNSINSGLLSTGESNDAHQSKSVSPIHLKSADVVSVPITDGKLLQPLRTISESPSSQLYMAPHSNLAQVHASTDDGSSSLSNSNERNSNETTSVLQNIEKQIPCREESLQEIFTASEAK